MVFWKRKKPRERELEEKILREVKAAMKEIEEAFNPIKLHEGEGAFTIMSKTLVDGRTVRLIMIGRLSEEEVREALEAYEKCEEKVKGSGWAVLVQKPG